MNNHKSDYYSRIAPMFSAEILRLNQAMTHYLPEGDELNVAVACLLRSSSHINESIMEKQATLEAEYDARVDEVKKALYDEGSLKSALIEEETK